MNSGSPKKIKIVSIGQLLTTSVAADVDSSLPIYTETISVPNSNCMGNTSTSTQKLVS